MITNWISDLITTIRVTKTSLQEPPVELDRYINCGHLDLGFNGMSRIRNLNRLSVLVSLQLQSNTLTRIEGLQYNLKLQQLNLSYNQIRVIDIGCLRHLAQLRNLNLSHNKLMAFPTQAVLESVDKRAKHDAAGELGTINEDVEVEQEEDCHRSSPPAPASSASTRNTITKEDMKLLKRTLFVFVKTEC